MSDGIGITDRLRAPRISNPLTLIAVFAGLAEIAATVALPQVDAAIQMIFVWFVMLFPILLVLLFFATLNWNTRVLYAPGDYRDDRTFVEVLGQARYGGSTDAAAKLEAYWRPGGRVDTGHQASLRKWMRENDFGTLPLTVFLTSDKYEAERVRAVQALGLTDGSK